MQNSILWTTTPGLGLIQDGALPNAVPGIGGSSAGGTTGAPGDPAAAGGPAGGAAAKPFGNSIFIMLALLLVFMIVSSMMSARRAKKQTAQMLGGLKRGDKVLTAAGIFGTVHEVRDDAVVLKIDDVSGTKVQFAKHAIQQVVKSAKGGVKELAADGTEGDN
ncbi:MAG: preprotein translocase subunit YajC [Planctomycetota bacterium]|nr:MAG: preprotein translocase subunit YajC [Planctomycetota bacterium]